MKNFGENALFVSVLPKGCHPKGVAMRRGAVAISGNIKIASLFSALLLPALLLFRSPCCSSALAKFSRMTCIEEVIASLRLFRVDF